MGSWAPVRLHHNPSYNQYFPPSSCVFFSAHPLSSLLPSDGSSQTTIQLCQASRYPPTHTHDSPDSQVSEQNANFSSLFEREVLAVFRMEIPLSYDSAHSGHSLCSRYRFLSPFRSFRHRRSSRQQNGSENLFKTVVWTRRNCLPR